MKARAWWILMIFAFATSIVAATSPAPSDRPVAVADKNWIEISEKLGFVLDEEAIRANGLQSRQVLVAAPDHVSAELLPPAKGYFMVKTPKGWRRLAMSE